MEFNQSKVTLLTAAVLCTFGASAHAQTSVTVSGLLETGVRYSTNQNAAGDHNITLGDGLINPSRLAFSGTEDLGGGLKAIFKLEAGVRLSNGKTSGGDTDSTLFGREAYVGLDGDFGKVTLGRQYTTGYVATWGFDPIYGGGLVVFAPYFGEVGLRQNNMIRYEKSLGAFGIQSHYALGEVAGSAKSGSSFGIGGTYNNGGVGLTAAYQETNDALNPVVNTEKTSIIGGSYAFDPVKLGLGYIHATNTSTAQKDDVLVASVVVSTGSPWTLKAVGYHRKQKSADGKNSMLVALADYALSKRTSLFLETDYNKYSDALVPATGKDTNAGFTVGIRHSF